ncbi:MAG: alanyl-tRNA editing protein AlaXM [Candidatus Anstonellaceae archaeon]
MQKTKTKLLYFFDSYLKEAEATVLDVQENKLILDQTIFYPTSGGQPSDRGRIKSLEDKTFQVDVLDVRKDNGDVIHFISSSQNLQKGQKVILELDWERRYKLMRMHTAAHVLSAVLFSQGALITGNQLDVDKSRFDFNTPKFDKEFLENAIKKANEICSEAHEVKTYFVSKQQALKMEGIIKLFSKNILEELEEIRIVEIEGVDIQADGGTHVKNTSEVGKITFIKAENKGKNNRRIYFTII